MPPWVRYIEAGHWWPQKVSQRQCPSLCRGVFWPRFAVISL